MPDGKTVSAQQGAPWSLINREKKTTRHKFSRTSLYCCFLLKSTAWGFIKPLCFLGVCIDAQYWEWSALNPRGRISAHVFHGLRGASLIACPPADWPSRHGTYAQRKEAGPAGWCGWFSPGSLGGPKGWAWGKKTWEKIQGFPVFPGNISAHAPFP